MVKLDLTKKVELYFNECPIKPEYQGEADSAFANSFNKAVKDAFCAVYVENDVPSNLHNQNSDMMLEKYGVHSNFAKEKNKYVMPFIMYTDSKTATSGAQIMDDHGKVNADSFKGTNCKVGGMFFNMDMANDVLTEFENQGYEIIKKYK